MVAKMNPGTETTMACSGSVIYRPHRLQQSGDAPKSDGGVEHTLGLETVGDQFTIPVQEVDDVSHVDVSTLW
jgi:hypothetical protein